jgi:zinc and cadmium transporter
MDLLYWIIGFSLLGGLLSVIVASSFLLLSENHRTFSVPHLVSFAIGALLGASFLGLLPHAIENDVQIDPHQIGLTLLLGLLLFFLLEKSCSGAIVIAIMAMSIFRNWIAPTIMAAITTNIRLPAR